MTEAAAIGGVERRRMADAGHLEEGLDTASPWYQWGPYVSERAWGSVREDYSADGDAWSSFPHDHARSRAYRWNEDGMAGLSDVFGRLNLGLALWNGQDPILKERMFGLTNSEGNHGEDVKEYWWYLDAVPSSAWLQVALPLPAGRVPLRAADRGERPAVEAGPGVRAARHRHLRRQPLLDRRGRVREGRPDRHPGADHRAQRGPRRRRRSTSCRRSGSATSGRTTRRATGRPSRPTPGRVTDPRVAPGARRLRAPRGARARTARAPDLLFCENETNAPRIFGSPATTPYPKDGINDHVVRGAATVNPAGTGTKAAAWYRLEVGPGETAEIRLRLRPRAPALGAGRGRRPGRPARRGVRNHDGRPPGGGRRVLRRPAPAGSDRRRGDDHAPGVRRDAVGQAVLRLRRHPLAQGRPDRPTPAAPSG